MWAFMISSHVLFPRTVLSSAGNDGRIRLWKANAEGVWKPAGSIGVEQTAEEPASQPENKDVDMEDN